MPGQRKAARREESGLSPESSPPNDMVSGTNERSPMPQSRESSSLKEIVGGRNAVALVPQGPKRSPLKELIGGREAVTPMARELGRSGTTGGIRPKSRKHPPRELISGRNAVTPMSQELWAESADSWCGRRIIDGGDCRYGQQHSTASGTAFTFIIPSTNLLDMFL